MRRRMISAFPGTCTSCKRRYLKGDYIWWHTAIRGKGLGSLCDDCGDPRTAGLPSAPAEPAWKFSGDTFTPEIPGSPSAKNGSVDFTIDWSDLKLIAQRVLKGELPKLKQENLERVLKCLVSPREEYNGYTSGQLDRWLREGFKTVAIQGLSEFTPPIRSKRRTIFTEEGDELHIDRVLQGEENFMSKSTRREVIPGVSMECLMGFQSGTSAKVINAFNVWICRSVYSLESAGIDAEVTMTHSTLGPLQGYSGKMTNTRVRVKKENEIADFVSFSPMLSPAAYRGFLWTATALHAESRGTQVESGLGKGSNRSTWSVVYDAAKRKILIGGPWHVWGDEFPEAKMTADLKAALMASMKGSNQ